MQVKTCRLRRSKVVKIVYLVLYIIICNNYASAYACKNNILAAKIHRLPLPTYRGQSKKYFVDLVLDEGGNYVWGDGDAITYENWSMTLLLYCYFYTYFFFFNLYRLTVLCTLNIFGNIGGVFVVQLGVRKLHSLIRELYISLKIFFSSKDKNGDT